MTTTATDHRVGQSKIGHRIFRDPMAKALAEPVRDNMPHGPATRLSLRTIRALLDTHPYKICGTAGGPSALPFAVDGDRCLAMEVEADFAGS